MARSCGRQGPGRALPRGAQCRARARWPLQRERRGRKQQPAHAHAGSAVQQISTAGRCSGRSYASGSIARARRQRRQGQVDDGAAARSAPWRPQPTCTGVPHGLAPSASPAAHPPTCRTFSSEQQLQPWPSPRTTRLTTSPRRTTATASRSRSRWARAGCVARGLAAGQRRKESTLRACYARAYSCCGAAKRQHRVPCRKGGRGGAAAQQPAQCITPHPMRFAPAAQVRQHQGHGPQVPAQPGAQPLGARAARGAATREPQGLVLSKSRVQPATLCAIDLRPIKWSGRCIATAIAQAHSFLSRLLLLSQRHAKKHNNKNKE